MKSRNNQIRLNTDIVLVHTDGSCDTNPGPGGWAALIIEDGKQKILKGFNACSTNNRMELTAAIEAIKSIEASKPIIIVTDSQYLRDGVEKWMADWKARNWKRKGGKLANVDLWKLLSEEMENRTISWQWVRSHTGNRLNEKVDKIARRMALSAK